jgi:hypothetical protein
MKWQATPAWRRRIAKSLPAALPDAKKTWLVEQIAQALARYDDLQHGESLSHAMDRHRALLHDLARLAKPLERQIDTVERRLEGRGVAPNMHTVDGALLAQVQRARKDLEAWRCVWGIGASGRPEAPRTVLASIVESHFVTAVGHRRGLAKLMRALSKGQSDTDSPRLSYEAMRKRAARRSGTNSPMK